MSEPTTSTDRAGKALAAALATRAEQLPPAIEARLASARQAALQAAEARLAPQVELQPALAGAAGSAPRGRAWAWMLPATLLVAGLLTLNHSQWLQQTLGLAERDAAVLKDELPPDAYSNPAFREYADEEQRDDETPPADEDEAKRR